MSTPAPQERRPREATTGTIERMGRGGGLNIVGALTNQAAMFAAISVMAWLGQRQVGRYATCLALLALLSLLSLAGFRSALTRFVAMHVADGDAARLRGTVRLGLGLTLAGSVVVALALALVAPWAARRLNDPSLETGIRLVALALPASAFSDAALSATQGWRTQRPFTLIGRIFEPVLRLALMTGAILLGLGFEGAMAALVVAAWAAALLSARALTTRMSGVPKVRPLHDLRAIFSFSMVSWVSALAATGLIWVDTLLLGALTNQRHVGSYNVATRLVMLAVFVMAPINAAFTPHMAHLLHRGEREEAARAYGTASRWILGLSMPAFVVLVVFPHQLLTYFGKGYAAAAAVTVILAFGQLVSAAAGPCGTVLNMSGRVGLNMVDNVAVLVLNVVLNLVLIPRYGIVGAAVAWSASLVAVNIAKVLQAYLVVGIRAAGSGIPRTLLAGGAAAVVALLTERWVSDWDDVVLIGAPTVLVVFCAVMAVLGVPTDDRALLGRLVPARVHRRSGAADRAQRVASADLRTDARGGGRHVA